jgi:ubiquinone biosynthesis protein UbiJ
MSTEEEIGYRDAIRQVARSLERRQKALAEELASADEGRKMELKARIEEVKHLLQTLESLRR